jgi:glycosyltransferase involved in cell wall biosynthesis
VTKSSCPLSRAAKVDNRVKSILIVTDAWHPQINGVVRSLERVSEVIEARGIKVHFLTPQDFRTVPMPGYGEIRLSITTRRRVFRMIEAANADAIHIATEGPLGFIARRYCVKHGIPFATSYHTQFPEYLRARAPVPLGWGYRYLRRFHSAAKYCLVPTQSVADKLAGYGLTNTVVWSRGVDLKLFNPAKRDKDKFIQKRPIFLYVGRVAVEKNIGQFLELDLPGSKIVVGDGPSRKALEARHTEVTFVGPKTGEELARYYASADCFVFPSRTDTFGLVLLEALASGTPVAALPVTGPLDVISTAPVGVLKNDLKSAALEALKIPRDSCRAFAAQFSWEASADQFLQYLPAIHPEKSFA